MPKRIDLPSGGWAELVTAEEITERRRRPIKRLQLHMARSVAVSGIGAAPPDPSEETRAQMTSAELADLDQQQMDWQRQAMMAMDPDQLTESDAVFVLNLLVGWSRPEAITEDAVLDLPIGDFDCLKDKAQAIVRTMYLDTSPKDLSEQSPTGPSSE